MAVRPTHTLTFLAFLGTTSAAALASSATPLAGQTCPQGEVSSIVVNVHSVFDTDPTTQGGALPWFYNLANGIHADTNEGFLRRELLLEVGECFDSFLMDESERLVRQLHFIDRVEVATAQQPDGSVQVVFDTWDRWTLNVDPRFRFEEGFEFNGINLAERNLLGRGMTLRAFYLENRERLAVGGRFSTTRLFGTRAGAVLEASRTRAGRTLQQGFSYPFVGEVGRFAGVQSFLDQEDLFSYTLPTGGPYTHVVQPFAQRSSEITGARRFGTPGRLTIIGGGLSRERWEYTTFDEGAEVVTDRDFQDAEPAPPEISAMLNPQIRNYSATRVNLVFAQRNLSFARRNGLDLLVSEQDIPVGGEVALMIGRTLSFLDANSAIEDSDYFGRIRLFGGLAPGRWVLASAISLEGRRTLGGAESGWTDILGEFDIYSYWRASENSRHTLFARVSGAGGWSATGPFQLTLGGSDGLRGYSRDDLPGGRRLIATVEDRIFFGSPGDGFADLGMTIFADVGSIWEGDVPFGADTGYLVTGGAGLRLGFPGGRRNVARIDIAFPLNGSDAFSQPKFRISSELLGLLQGVEDRQLRRSRRSGAGSAVLPDPSVGR